MGHLENLQYAWHGLMRPQASAVHNRHAPQGRPGLLAQRPATASGRGLFPTARRPEFQRGHGPHPQLGVLRAVPGAVLRRQLHLRREGEDSRVPGEWETLLCFPSEFPFRASLLRVHGLTLRPHSPAYRMLQFDSVSLRLGAMGSAPKSWNIGPSAWDALKAESSLEALAPSISPVISAHFPSSLL